MKAKGVKGKGREFQKEIAGVLARTFDLTVLALSPRSAGKTVQGVRYVSEREQPDLLVRESGQPGADVVPLSPRAAACWPFLIEAKIRKQMGTGWNLISETEAQAELWHWLKQAREHVRHDMGTQATPLFPLVVFRVFRKNALCAVSVRSQSLPWLIQCPLMRYVVIQREESALLVLPFVPFVEVLRVDSTREWVRQECLLA